MTENIKKLKELESRLLKGLSLIEEYGSSGGKACTREESKNQNCSGCMYTPQTIENKGLKRWCHLWKTWKKLLKEHNRLYAELSEEEREELDGERD